MTVYKRPDSEFYSYDFQLNGERHSGPTFAKTKEDALRAEQEARDELGGVSPVIRRVLSKARRTLTARVKRSGYIYVLRSRYFIKIGYSVTPEDRLRSIETATPEECELLFVVPGDIKLERQLHREFAACHYRREWFFLCGKLKHFIEEFERQNKAEITQSATKTPREREFAGVMD